MTPTEFDLTGPLPNRGTWVLEASAGTGKTYAIAALAARYLAEGVPLSALMVVTFSRAATAELRDRVRARLALAEGSLRRRLVGDELPDADPVTALICAGTPEELRTRLARLSAALGDLDAATIATTHEFCGRMLDGLGLLADRPAGAAHSDDVSDLAREVAADFWLRKYAGVPDPELPWAQALEIAVAVCRDDDPVEPADDVRAQFARALRAEVDRRKRVAGIVTYDDLLTDLLALIRGRRTPGAEPDPQLAAATTARLRERFQVVLIDEFQDTDPTQWAIVKEAFVGHATVVLIGDPKQAIYGFRRADVQCYLEATTDADEHRTLSTNWRSDAPLLAAIDTVMGGAELGDPRIVVRPVTARHATRLQAPDAERQAALRLRTLPRDPADRSWNGPQVRHVRQRIADDLVAQVQRLLDGSVTLHVDEGQPRRVRASDIAVITNRHATAATLREKLTAAGIAAVHTGAPSVFGPGSVAADDWALLLTALRTQRAADVRRLALTDFVGWTFRELATADDLALNELTARVRLWSRTLAQHGVASLMTQLAADGLATRLLAHSDGERRWTDLRHIGQALHAAALRDRLGVAGLAEWLAERRSEASTGDDERTRRLETDDVAVSLMTVHAAKGLEFPIVLLPEAWDLHQGEFDGEPVRHRGPDGVNRLWIGGRGSRGQRAHADHLAEDRAEALRRFYVALTRAECQTIVWWAANKSNTPASALHRLLHRDHPSAVPEIVDWERDPADLRALRDDPAIHVTEVPAAAARSTTRRAGRTPATVLELSARRLDRPLDTDWRRTSYSGLTAGVHELPPVPEIGALVQVDDEPEPEASAAAAAVTTGVRSPMADLPRGADFGTLVHAVYENFDPAAPDLLAELERVCAHWVPRLPIDTTARQLAEALLPSVLTRLGPIADGLRLADIPCADRLAELDFQIPMAGGDSPVARHATIAAIADLLERHLPTDDPLASYAARLRDPRLAGQALRGYLIGSIDAVLRLPGADGPRHLVVDYKTNWLGPFDGSAELSTAHYTPERMAEAMMDAHYPLQALLYAVALHRFLRWRQPDYDPERHLGGVAYLFVRGMTPEAADPTTPPGVFTWRPPVALVEDLSTLLATGSPLREER